jgi:D-lactate dehydrogenase
MMTYRTNLNIRINKKEQTLRLLSVEMAKPIVAVYDT